MYTQLTNRKLWYDGDSSYNESQIYQVLKQKRVAWVDSMSEDIKAYNRLMPAEDRIREKTSLSEISNAWIPEVDTITLDDIFDYVTYNHIKITKNMPDDQAIQRDIRLAKELHLFQNTPDMMDMVKSIIYVVNTLTVSKQVWGVGRGSSVSSYLLYVIGAHDVDSFEYDLEVTDFIPKHGAT